MKIKTKKQLNLPQLIEWIEKNRSYGEVFTSDRYNCVHVNVDGVIEFAGTFYDDTFTVEVEEEIKEDTAFNMLVALYKYPRLQKIFSYRDNTSIRQYMDLEDDNVSAIYMVNDDSTMTLIWRDGKLVE